MPLPPVHAEVRDHRPCRRCGYDLMGLPADGSCPECGAAIAHRDDTRFADNLTDAPLDYLKRLTIAAWVLALSILLGAGARVLIAFGVITLPQVADGALVLATSAWALGVLLVTTKREKTDKTTHDALLDTPKFRAAVRLTQAAAPLAAMSAVAAVRMPSPAIAIAFVVAAGVLGLVAFLGASALCAYLSSLADWAGDNGVAERFRASAWGIAVCGLASLVSALLAPLAPAMIVVAAWASVFLFLAVCLFAFCIFELGRLTSWAVSNNITAAARDERVAARQHRESEEFTQRVSDIDDAVPYETAARRPPHQPPEPGQEEPLPLSEPDPDAEIDLELDGLAPTPRAPRPSKIRHPHQTFPPVGRHASVHDTPAAPRPRDADTGEAHYEEHRVDPGRPADPD